MLVPGVAEAHALRAALENGVWYAATSFDPDKYDDQECPAYGQCAVTALLAHDLFGWDIVSTNVSGVSHWFNSVEGVDIDITGDQFGTKPVRYGVAPLWPGRRLRQRADANSGTLSRLWHLKQRLLKRAARTE